MSAAEVREIIKEVNDTDFHLAILDEMEKLVDYSLTKEYHTVRGLALDIVKDCKSKDYRCEASKIYNWVFHNIRYVRDITTKETLHSAENVLREGQTDCDGFAILLASLLMSIGFDCRFAVIRGSNNKNFHHVYCEVEVDGEWLSLDPSDKSFSFGQEYPYEEKMVYNIKAFYGNNNVGDCKNCNPEEYSELVNRKKKIIKNLNQSYQKQLALGIDPVTAMQIIQKAPEYIEKAKQIIDKIKNWKEELTKVWDNIKAFFSNIFGGGEAEHYDLSMITFESIDGYLFWKSYLHQAKQSMAQSQGQTPIPIMRVNDQGKRVQVGQYYGNLSITQKEQESLYLRAVKEVDNQGFKLIQIDAQKARQRNVEYAKILIQNKVVTLEQASKLGLDYQPKPIPKPPISPSQKRANMRNNTTANSRLHNIPQWVYFVMPFMNDSNYLKFVEKTKFYNVEFLGKLLWDGKENLRKHYPFIYSASGGYTQSQIDADKKYVWDYLEEKALEYISVNGVTIDPAYLSNQCTLPGPSKYDVVFPSRLLSLGHRDPNQNMDTLNESKKSYQSDFDVNTKGKGESDKLKWAVSRVMFLLSKTIDGIPSPSGDLATWNNYVNNHPELWEIVQSSAWFMYNRLLWEIDFMQTVLALWRNDIADELQTNSANEDAGMSGTINIEDDETVVVEQEQKPVEEVVLPKPSEIPEVDVPDDVIQAVDDIEKEKQAVIQQAEELRREKQQLEQREITPEARQRLNVLTQGIPELEKRVSILNQAGIKWQETNAHTLNALVQIDEKIQNLESQLSDERQYVSRVESKIMPEIDRIKAIGDNAKQKMNFVWNLIEEMKRNYPRTQNPRLLEYIVRVEREADRVSRHLELLDYRIEESFKQSHNIFKTKDEIESNVQSIANRVDQIYNELMGRL